MKPETESKYGSWMQLQNHLTGLASTLLLCLVTLSISAQTYQVVYYFDGSNGANPWTSPVLAGDTLYGTMGGPGQGAVFKVGTNGSGYAILHTFTGPDGAAPYGDLMVSGTTLYGSTYVNGANGGGTVFKVNTDGSGFTVLKAFFSEYYGGRLSNPKGGLTLSGTTLYGTCFKGAVFKLNTDGSGFADLGIYEYGLGGTLLLSGATLYGMPFYSVPFKVNTDGSGCAGLCTIGRSTGGFILSGATLYGTAIQYDSPVRGFVFKVDTNGSNYALVHTFGPASNEGAPYAGVTLSGTMLLGTTSDGGISNMGTIFKVNTDGSGYNLLHSFTDNDGASPYSHLALSGSTIYGTAVYGGSAHAGVVFSLSLAPPTILASPQDQTVVSGTTVTINVEATGGPVLGCQWYFNNTNYIGCTTNCFLELSNVQPGQSGAYTVVVTNLFGAATSSPAMLNVIVVAPTILRPPVSQTAVLTSDVKLSVAVRGSLPMTYQWLLNSERLPDGTNRALFLSGVQMSDVGAYTVVISNLVGVITSAPAQLNVIAPFEQRPVPAVKLSGDPGSLLHLSCAATPGPGAAWQELDAVALAATQQFYPDLTEPRPSSRFYRARQTNVPSMQPVLEMSLAAELTLTGGIGSNVRVDCINQIGPTDAWLTLDTVALTNTTQPYFDFTMFRQPTRLYRAVPVP